MIARALGTAAFAAGEIHFGFQNGWQYRGHMRLGEVELPDEVVSAHRDGSLVLFVGAGASVDSPSGLPTFHELATQISRERNPEAPDPVAGHEDGHLDSLQQEGMDVHSRVQQIVTSADSEPNELHHAIVRLATTSPQTRIVTTNYDSHLSACLPPEADLDPFAAPDLPARADFSGIVYLHGDARRRADDLVVTASDFGRAYLRDGWALDFLKKLFAEATVLFIGYSHRDTLMTYLARGLPETSRRYMLHSSASQDTWTDHGIRPIPYGSRGGLPQLLQRWADRASMGALDHAARVREVVRGIPPLNVEDDSYLDDIVSDPSLVHHFTNAAQKFAAPALAAAWLDWMTRRPQFVALFDALAPKNELSRRLATWFSDEFIAKPSLTTEALRIVGQQGAAFSDDLWEQAIWAVHKLEKPSASAGLWAALLAQAMQPGGQSHLSMLLNNEPAWDDETLLLLFERLTEPVLVIESTGRVSSEPAARVGLDSTSWWFEHTWRRHLEPRLDELAPELLRIADRNLRYAHRLLAPGEPSLRRWSYQSRLRKAISPHWQNLPRRQGAHRLAWIDLLIDVARDSLRCLASRGSPQAAHYIESWLMSRMPLLRRLGLDGIGHRSDITSDDKIQQLIESGIVGDSSARQEVLALLEIALPHAEKRSVDAITAHVAPSSEAWERDSAAAAGRLLLWITQHADNATQASATLAELRASFPDIISADEPVDLLQRDEPKLASAIEKTPAAPLLDPVSLHSTIEQSPKLAVDWLRGGMEGADEPPALHERMGALATVISQYPRDGLAVIDCVMSSSSPNVWADQQVADAVLDAWRKNLPTGGDLTSIRSRFGEIWRFGTDTWLIDTGISGDSITWLDHALNHWAGSLAQLLLQCAYLGADDSDEAPDGLPDDLKQNAARMLSKSSFAGRCAQAILIGRLDLLYIVDREWSRTNLLPLLDPTHGAERAVEHWECFVLQGQRTVGMLEDGLAELFVGMLPHMKCFDSDARHAFFEHLAAITCFDGDFIDRTEWLANLTRNAGAEVGAEWMRHVGGTLARLTADEADAQWTAWMRTYWQRRLDSLPTVLTDAESTEIAHWTIQLASCFPEAVEFVIRRPPAVSNISRFLENLHTPDARSSDASRPDWVAEYPQSVVALLTHLLTRASAPPNDTFFLPEIIQKLKKQADYTIVEPLLEAALALDLIRDHDAEPTGARDDEQASPSVSPR